ncbi:MAG: LytTR family DNA-binding domain-containing protein [Bacteroidia bacterium]|jgi:two-component system LytT family response regulator
MIKAILIDDETKSRQTTRELLRKYCTEIEVIGEASSAEEAWNAIKTTKPDLIFLDIEMPYEDGFDFLKRFDNIPFEIIFITAYNQYAIRAIRICALDYLLKPLSINDLKQAVERAKIRIADKTSAMQYNTLQQNLNQPQSLEHGKLAIPTGFGFEFLEMKDIIALEADGGYTTIKLAGGKSVVSTRNLKEYEDILPDTVFFRSHHSFILNLSHIRKYHKGEGGYVVMSDMTSIAISKRNKKEFLERFNF